MDARTPAPTDAVAMFATYAQDPEVTRLPNWQPHTRVGAVQAYISH